MNLSPLRQIFSDVADRAAQFYQRASGLNSQQSLTSLKQFFTPGFTNDALSKENDVILHRLSQDFSPNVAQQGNDKQVKNDADVQKLWSNLSDEVKQQISKAVADHKNDKEFREMLAATIKDPQFAKLNSSAQSSVIKHLDRVAATENYLKMGRPERLASLYIISDLSFYAVAHPSFKMAQNTLEQIISGQVKMGIEDLSKTEFNNVRASYKSKDNTIYFNIGNQSLLKNSQELMKTAAHEINHALNSNKAINRFEEFLEEYRAYYVEGAAAGERSPTLAKMQEKLSTLLLKKPYEFYKECAADPGFDKVVNGVISDYKKGKITTPEELRQKLLALPGREKSIYLNTKPNLDNH